MNDPAFPKQTLAVHEWIAVVVACGILTGLSLVTYFNRDTCNEKPSGDTFFIKSPIVRVVIEGAVEKPGIFCVDKSLSMIEAVQLAKPLPEADLDDPQLSGTVGRKKKIQVPHTKTIQVYVSGAVLNPGLLTVSKGAKLQDLADIVAFHDEADVDVLRKKRMLKNNEKIFVPYCE